jgi:integral membrane sensor domain MASE1
MALAFTLGVALVGGIGWFLLSWLTMREPAGNAAGEALGVAFGALIVASVIGAIRAARRRTAGSSDSTDADEGRETHS